MRHCIDRIRRGGVSPPGSAVPTDYSCKVPCGSLPPSPLGSLHCTDLNIAFRQCRQTIRVWCGASTDFVILSECEARSRRIYAPNVCTAVSGCEDPSTLLGMTRDFRFLWNVGVQRWNRVGGHPGGVSLRRRSGRGCRDHRVLSISAKIFVSVLAFWQRRMYNKKVNYKFIFSGGFL